jgi:hypothetical protein
MLCISQNGCEPSKKICEIAVCFAISRKSNKRFCQKSHYYSGITLPVSCESGLQGWGTDGGKKTFFFVQFSSKIAFFVFFSSKFQGTRVKFSNFRKNLFSQQLKFSCFRRLFAKTGDNILRNFCENIFTFLPYTVWTGRANLHILSPKFWSSHGGDRIGS